MAVVHHVIQYIRASRAELEKVSWPSRRETVRYSALVIAVSVIVAAFFGLLDGGLNKIVQAVVTRTPAADTSASPVTTVPTPTTGQAPPPVTLTPSDVQAHPINGEGSAKVQVTPLPLTQPTFPSKP